MLTQSGDAANVFPHDKQQSSDLHYAELPSLRWRGKSKVRRECSGAKERGCWLESSYLGISECAGQRQQKLRSVSICDAVTTA